MSVSYEPVPAKNTPAVILLNLQCQPRFISSEGRRLCDTWNAALGEGAPAARQNLRLLDGVASLLTCADASGWGTECAGVRVRHPTMPGLSVTIQRGGATPGVCAHAWLLLTFEANDECAAAIGSAQIDCTLSQLSPSERRVALLVAEGLRNDEVAQRLHRSRRTIEYQLNAIFRKLDLTCRSQLVRALT